ncbi:MAG: hypothetical protein V4560_19330 [Bacteroidota bacterium]
MRKYLLFFIILLATCYPARAQYLRSKKETIDLINSILKLREETRLYGPEPGKVNYLILSQQLSDDSFKQLLQTTDKKQLTTLVTKIKWEAFSAFGYNDNRSELYLYFDKKIIVNNIPAEVFSFYVPDSKVNVVKDAVFRLVDIAKE